MLSNTKSQKEAEMKKLPSFFQGGVGGNAVNLRNFELQYCVIPNEVEGTYGASLLILAL